MPFTDVTVRLVDEDQLPAGHIWALVRQHRKTESEPPRELLFVKRTATPAMMADIADKLDMYHRAG